MVFLHLFTVSMLLYFAAPLVFNAVMPQNPGLYFVSLAIFVAVLLGMASLIGLAIKDQVKTSMASVIAVLLSIMFSGIMFSVELRSKAFKVSGKCFLAA